MWETGVLFFGLAVLVHSQYEGDACVKNGASGTCLPLDNCQPAINDIKRRIPPQICSFSGMTSIVCCVESSPPAPTVTRRPPAPTTSRPPVLTTSKQRITTTTEYVPPVYDYVVNDPSTAAKDECEPVSPKLTAPRTGRKAWDKCIEYQEKYVYPCVDGNALSGGKARVNRCKHNADDLIVGGVNASKSEFPHMALLGFGTDLPSVQWQCGGSIISERFILTAGHCTRARNLGPVTYALVGILSKKEHVDSSMLYRVEVIKHPQYRPPHKYNDIALLRTDRDIAMSQEVLPACLHVDTSAADQRVWATGWGATQNKGTSPDVLQKVVLNKFSEFECALLFPPARLLANGFDANTQLCYGDKDKSKDTCQGDSGGPLQLPGGRIHCMYTVVGVTSYGRACGVVGEPGIYSRVAAFVPWIESVVWP
ncbi:unnamed protein product, partial [Iphiclides podalirius]